MGKLWNKPIKISLKMGFASKTAHDRERLNFSSTKFHSSPRDLLKAPVSTDKEMKVIILVFQDKLSLLEH